MVAYRVGGKAGRLVQLDVADNMVAVKGVGQDRFLKSRLESRARTMVRGLTPVTMFSRNRIAVMGTGAVELSDALATLKKDDAVDFAGHVLIDPANGQPAIYREKLFIAFMPDATTAQIRAFQSRHDKRLVFERQTGYSRLAFIAAPVREMGRTIFDLALELLEEDIVDRCHPEVLREKVTRKSYPGQWHLGKRKIGGRTVDQSASVEAAWSRSTGKGVKIAIIDDGVDMLHPEFAAKGKVVDPYEAESKTANANPRDTRDNHGTACAGVACAAGIKGAKGVAPDAALMPIRNVSDLGSLAEADAIWWAVDHGADVISCSWGPPDGDWGDPNDPLHQAVWQLQDNTALAIEAAVARGRSGRGCVIAWAAGNGNESVDLDGWAAHPGVMAVAACNDRGSKSVYSDFGDAISCAFPSNDFGPDVLTPGIWTTDRRGRRGYNPGDTSLGDAKGDYANDFGGTSSACPGVAGVAALVIAADLGISAADVRKAIEKTADKIDQAGGAYDAKGHSKLYGAGRVNAEAAVKAVAKIV